MKKTDKALTFTRTLLKYGLVIILLQVGYITQISAQVNNTGMKKTNAPITANVNPKTATMGKTVKIEGSTIADGKRFDVVAIITSPDKKSVTLTEKIDKDGNFKFEYKKTNQIGKYTIEIIAPDKKGSITKSFEVMSFFGIFTESAESFDEVARISKEFTKKADKIISNESPTEDTRELQRKTTELKNHLAKSEQAFGKYREALKGLAQLIAENPEIAPAFQDFATELASENEKTKDGIEKFKADLEKSEQDGERCNLLDTLNETFNAISFLLNLTTNPIGLAVNFAIDKGLPRTIDATISNETGLPPTSAKRFAITEGLKTYAARLADGAKALTPAGWVATGVGLANSTAQFAAKSIFLKICEQFEGPVQGTFNVQHFDKGTFFWSYDMKIRGKLITQFAKRTNPGDPVKFKGRIEGNITDIKIKDNTIGTYNKTVQKSFIAKKIIPPPTSPYIEDFGTAARAATPGSFNLPITGEIINGEFSFKWLPPIVDFSPLFKGQAIFILVTPVIPIPQIVYADMPFQNAEFIFTRSLGRNPKIKIEKDEANKSLTVKEDFERVHDSPSFKLKININLKACNPGCLKYGFVEN